jgi:hypothetical protein
MSEVSEVKEGRYWAPQNSTFMIAKTGCRAWALLSRRVGVNIGSMKRLKNRNRLQLSVAHSEGFSGGVSAGVFAAIFLLSAIVCDAATTERISFKGRTSETSIRAALLESTPIGSSVSDVALFLNRRLKHEGGHVPTIGNGSAWHLVATGKKKTGNFEFDSIPDLTPRFSEKWIGSDFDVPIILTIYHRFPFKVWVIGDMAFRQRRHPKEHHH